MLFFAGYSDLINGARSLPQQLTNGNLTVEGCLNACTTNGAKVCGEFLSKPLFELGDCLLQLLPYQRC